MPLPLIDEAESDGSNLSEVYTHFQTLMLKPIYSDAELLQVKKMEFHPTKSMGYDYFLSPVNQGGLGMFGNDLDDTLDDLDDYIQCRAENDERNAVLQTELIDFKSFVAQSGEKNRDKF